MVKKCGLGRGLTISKDAERKQNRQKLFNLPDSNGRHADAVNGKV